MTTFTGRGPLSTRAYFDKIAAMKVATNVSSMNMDDTHVLFRRIAVETLRQRPEGNRKVLDVGIGTGSFWADILPNVSGIKVTGIEFSKESGAICNRSIKPDYLLQIDAEAEKEWPSYAIGKDSFDLVVCKSVFQYIQNATRLVERMLRAAKPGATILANNNEIQNSDRTVNENCQLALETLKFFHHPFEIIAGAATRNGATIRKIDTKPYKIHTEHTVETCTYEITKPALE